MEKQFKNYESGKVLQVLQSLGYPISQDYGNYIRTQAIYRDGDAQSTLKVFKDSGWCVDFAANDKFPLFELVKRTLGTDNTREVLSYIGGQKVICAAPKQKLKMQKTYDPKILERLFPNYSFYNKRGISDATQKLYKCGLASEGKMYQRMVFPIFNDEGTIHGFSGRHINHKEDSAAPKWKHLGERNSWLYPYLTVPECMEAVKESPEIILVESIGDSMALFENNIKNHLVTFGLDNSAAITSLLIKQDEKIITIATNNDSQKTDQLGNRGLTAAIKIMMKLSAIFPLEILQIKLPLANDFGDMHQQKMNFYDWQTSKPLDNGQIKEYIKENKEKFKNTEKFLAKL